MTLVTDRPALHPAVAAAMGRHAHFITPKGARVVRAAPLGRDVFFVVNNGADRIHRKQTKGVFYEQDTLRIMAQHMPEGGVFVDIGANIGNHSLFMAVHGGAARIVPVEANPEAIALFVAVMRLNGLGDRVAFEALGYGAGDHDGEGFAIAAPKGNLGWARVVEGGGDIALRTGDSLLAGERRVDMIKIDVEGMEIAALAGLRKTVAAHRPVLFVEVDHGNAGDFDALMAEWGYAPVHVFEPSRMNRNYLMAPA